MFDNGKRGWLEKYCEKKNLLCDGWILGEDDIFLIIYFKLILC